MTGRRTPRPKRHPPELEAIAHDWTDEQAKAVHDFCSALQELVWRRYHDALIDPMLQDQFKASATRHVDKRTYPLPFEDDDLPF